MCLDTNNLGCRYYGLADWVLLPARWLCWTRGGWVTWTRVTKLNRIIPGADTEENQGFLLILLSSSLSSWLLKYIYPYVIHPESRCIDPRSVPSYRCESTAEITSTCSSVVLPTSGLYPATWYPTAITDACMHYRSAQNKAWWHGILRYRLGSVQPTRRVLSAAELLWSPIYNCESHLGVGSSRHKPQKGGI